MLFRLYSQNDCLGQDVHQEAASVFRGCLDLVGVDPDHIGDYELHHLGARLLDAFSASTMAGHVPSQRALRSIFFCVWPERVD